MTAWDRAKNGLEPDTTLDPASPLGPAVEADRLRSLYEIGIELLNQDDPTQVTLTIRDAIARHLKPAQACIIALKADGSYRSVLAHNMILGTNPRDWPLSHTCLDRVRDSGLSMLVNDVQAASGLAEAESVKAYGIRTILCVPLGRPVHTMIYADRRGAKGAFGRSDLEFLTAIAVYAGLALDRTESYLKAKEALETSDARVAVLQEELLRHKIVGRSPKLLAAYDEVRRFAKAGARVLLRGETGTGKELFARAYAQKSASSHGSYFPIPIPSLSPTLVESELFGHVRGAFTEAARDKKGRLELAEGGVLFLDEVGDISPDVQVKLLRFLDSGELCRVGDTAIRHVDARVVSATNRPLEKDVADGRFRADLLARLGHVVVLPPLRERLDDVPVLVDHFLGVYGGASRGLRFSAEALEIMARHDWPLNVRELQQVVERAVCMCDQDEIGPSDLPAYLCASANRNETPPAAAQPESASLAPQTLRAVVDAAERSHIERTLDFTGGNRRRAAEILGVSPDTFYRRLRDLGLQERRDPDSVGR